MSSTLQEQFPASQVLLPDSEQYEEYNSSYLAAQQSEIRPSAIFQPKSAEEVARFVKMSAAGGFAFAVRGGGQNPLPHSSNIEKPGITLDLALLNSVKLGEGSISVGAGARWGAVYEALEGMGLGVSGNRSGKGGIGGLALQGGLSFFSSREGFICDNVLNYEVVLASGDVINANADENSDLWLALRGGSNNFGVVTRYDLRTFAQGPFWGGSVYYFGHTFPEQIDALVKELQDPAATKETHLMISVGFAAQFGSQAMCQNQVYYTQGVEKPAVLEPFVSMVPQIDAMNSMRMMTLKEAASEQASDAKQRTRCSYMNTTIIADAATLKAAYEIYTTSVETISNTEGLVCSLTLQPYSRSCLESSAVQGGNSLGLDAANGPLVSILLLTYWSKKEDDSKIEKTMRGVLEKIEQDSMSRKTAVPFKFLNYSSQFQDPIGSYGEKNKQKLQEVSKKYDPTGVFQKSVPGGFKLFT